MGNMKFLITDVDFITKKLKDWRCDKCGSADIPQIVGKEDENGELLEMHIICSKCKRDIIVRDFNF